MLSPICSICQSTLEGDKSIVSSLDLSKKERSPLELKCGCIFHQACIASIVKVQLQNNVSPSCYNCAKVINIKQEQQSPADTCEREFYSLNKEEEELDAAKLVYGFIIPLLLLFQV